MTISVRQLNLLFAKLRRIARPRDEWSESNNRPLIYYIGAHPYTSLIFCTKFAGLLGINQKIFEGASIFDKQGPLEERYMPCIAQEAVRLKQSIKFLGDLDPLDLTSFLVLKTGMDHYKIKVNYCGIDDEWIRVCTEVLSKNQRGKPRTIPTIPMTPFEVEHMRLLEYLPIDWKDVIGPLSLELLRKGRKLELEGATNPAFYSSSLIKFIRSRMIRQPQQPHFDD
jgi:hypothetical protein